MLPALSSGGTELIDVFHEISDGLETARRVGAKRFLWHGTAVLAELHRAMGNEDRAREYFAAAQEGLRELAASAR